MVQRTVSYASGGRSLRDVNAKTKVTARAMIYSIPPDIVTISFSYAYHIQTYPTFSYSNP